MRAHASARMQTIIICLNWKNCKNLQGCTNQINIVGSLFFRLSEKKGGSYRFVTHFVTV